MDTNQGTPAPTPPPDVDAASHAIGGEAVANRAAEDARAEALQVATARDEALRVAQAVGGMAHHGLKRWTALVFLGAIAAFVAGRPDAALFLAVAGMFALSQSWDARDRARTGDPFTDGPLIPGDFGHALRLGVPLLPPLVGAIFYFGFGAYARTLDTSPDHTVASYWCFGAVFICLMLALPPVTRAVAGVFMRGSPPTHTVRLTAALSVVVLLLPVPVRLLFDEFLRVLTTQTQPLADVGGLVAQLAGEVLFAAAAVGLWVARDPRAVCDRLGLGRMGTREWLVAAAGLAAVIGLNAGMEWLERTHLHHLWAEDQAMGRLIAGDLSLAGVLALGVSAGVGEELLVRGALQPRVGVLWASVLFAAGHVQYTWFGMATILLLGVTLGLVRRFTNTTTAITVHALYDIVAAIGTTS